MKLISLALMTALSSAYAGSVYDHKLKDIDGETLYEHRQGHPDGQRRIQMRVHPPIQGIGRVAPYQGQGLVCGFPCSLAGRNSRKGRLRNLPSKFGVTFDVLQD